MADGARLGAWNARMNGLPRKAMLVALTLLLAALFFLLLPYCWPFVLVFLFSRLLEAPVRLFQRRLKRPVATALCVLMLFGLAGWVLSALVSRLFQELAALVKTLPQAVAWLSDTAIPWVRQEYLQYQALLPAWVADAVSRSLSLLGESLLKWAGTLSAALTSGAWSTAASIPYALLSMVLTVMGTYYMTADRARIAAFFRRTLPSGIHQKGRALWLRLLRALMGQMRSQLMVSLAITVFLMLALGAFRVRYGLLIGLVIGVADALPVLGAGLFLIPWSLLSFLTGDIRTGVLAAALYVGAVVIRQVLEPRLVGKHLGLYPLAAMVSMFAGYRLMGFLGLLAGPVLLNVAKVILEADGRGAMAPP